MFDNHVHSLYSFDVTNCEKNSVKGLCQTAYERGLSGIAFTDHYDTDAIRDGFFPPLDHNAVQADVEKAKIEFKGKVSVLYGIELGQATHMPDEANELINSRPYDIVLASCHGVRGILDFHDANLETLPKNEYVRLWDLYIEEMLDTIKWGNFDVLTHLTYPKRYYVRAGITDFPDIKNKGREYFEPILKAVINSGKTLECNTSGLRQPIGECLPNPALLTFYYELGGRDICLGSDAHSACYVASDFRSTTEMLKTIGFKYSAYFNSRKKDFETL